MWTKLTHSQYNYVLSAALDVGTALSALFIFLVLRLPGANISWWGNTVYTASECMRRPETACPSIPGAPPLTFSDSRRLGRRGRYLQRHSRHRLRSRHMADLDFKVLGESGRHH